MTSKEGRIRPIALAVIRDSRGRYLLSQAEDSVKGEKFYRPLGGGIEFHETGAVAVEREIMEEISLAVEGTCLIGCLENIFTYLGKPGHEIVMMYELRFKDSASYSREQFDIIEGGRVSGRAVWRTFDEIAAEGAKLYPNGLGDLLKERR